MRVLCVIEHGRAPSTRLRLSDCVERYRRAGIEVTVVSARRSSFAERFNILKQATRHDAVALFKTTSFSRFELWLLQRINARIVFDFDDAVMFRNQKYRRPLRLRDFEKFMRTVNRCAIAVAGNGYLGCFAEACGRPVVVLPTPIDLSKYTVRQDFQGAGLTIGWVGLSDGLSYLQSIQPALQTLTERFPGLTLKVVSDKPLQLEGVTVENIAWAADTEQLHLRSFDIGIMPLWDSLWTRGKCGYKILQYMAAGIPTVASAVGANIDIITDGVNGFVVRSQEDWVASLSKLIEDPRLRQSVGLRGRALVESNYSLDRFADRYIETFQSLERSTTAAEVAAQRQIASRSLN